VRFITSDQRNGTSTPWGPSGQRRHRGHCPRIVARIVQAHNGQHASGHARASGAGLPAAAMRLYTDSTLYLTEDVQRSAMTQRGRTGRALRPHCPGWGTLRAPADCTRASVGSPTKIKRRAGHDRGRWRRRMKRWVLESGAGPNPLQPPFDECQRLWMRPRAPKGVSGSSP